MGLCVVVIVISTKSIRAKYFVLMTLVNYFETNSKYLLLKFC